MARRGRPGVNLEAGTLLTPRLRLVRPIGRGGMGSVWVADHLGLDTQVAVKVVHRDLAHQRPEYIERFRREAATAATLKNPHVARVYDQGVAKDGTPFMAMELLDGESLHQRLKRDQRIESCDVVLIAEQVCQVLEEAAKVGVVHRDIKPANLFLLSGTYDIFVKVLDFGIAKRRADWQRAAVTREGVLLGSPLYMSPEQLVDARGVDGRADLWSLAVVLYQLLVGTVPFRGRTLGELSMAILERTMTPASEAASLPDPVDAFFAKAFAYHIQDRFQHADELFSAFRAVMRPSLLNAGVRTSPGSSGSRDFDATLALEEAPSQETPLPLPPPSLSAASPADPGTLSPTLTSKADVRHSSFTALAAGMAMLGLGLAVYTLGSRMDPSGSAASRDVTSPPNEMSTSSAPPTESPPPSPPLEASSPPVPEPATNLRPSTSPKPRLEPGPAVKPKPYVEPNPYEKRARPSPSPAEIYDAPLVPRAPAPAAPEPKPTPSASPAGPGKRAGRVPF